MNLTLTSREHLGDDIWRYTFSAPEQLAWIAGQFLRVDIPHEHPDDAGTSRFFTISAPPSSLNPQITTRRTPSTFKQGLHQLRPGQPMTLLDLPAGDFIWPDDLYNPVFIARGIGITPFYAILTDRATRGLPLSATLIHSNRPHSFMPYHNELSRLSRDNPEFTYAPTIETLEVDKVAAIVPDLPARTVYVSGPNKLLALLRPPYNLPAKQLKTDYFPGYSADAY